MINIQACRYHDISTGHRVYGHESKCAHFHGHNYRIHFNITSKELDSVGRVLDFSKIKEILCMWLEDNWDHKFMLWDNDPCALNMKELDPTGVIIVPFNPTAENMGEYLITTVAPELLKETSVRLESVIIEETQKCSVKVEAK